jgi:hypothetical protein
MKLPEVHAEIAEHCGEISDLFKPGCKVTILVRNPSLKDGDVLVSDDAIDAVVAALQRLKEKDEVKLSWIRFYGIASDCLNYEPPIPNHRPHRRAG